ncbi:GH92 family glycosyl hydrolase [Flammeovirga agarivorans]|uniref:Glycoside hydrolase family 92 protein n=1 Tax=Flammeovirga agarivorans TaxID=2726742 RepID=A0A7X8SLU2_9BACT|nr:GH92 family glycosyl hydrolase [Flammeovirga agarivorans]NLR92580.1 glycoside hydrolase family 92 protein [Flammeovirga agarivorans]
MKSRLLLSLVTIFIVAACGTKEKQTETKERYTSYVNPFVGTDGPGNTYPGATVPHGMVQLSPDNGISGWDRIAGYFWPDSTIAGFSHTHLSGTGAGDLYDILVMPLNSKSTRMVEEGGNLRPVSLFSHDQEHAEPGYYTVDLLDYDIKAELTATSRTGFHKYTFPKDKESFILFNLGYSLNWDGPTDTYIKVVDEKTIEGYRFSSGWAPEQREYFVAEFSQPFTKYQLINSVDGKNLKEIKGEEVKAKKTRGYFFFDTPEVKNEILVKVGLSNSSIDGARKNLQAENTGWDFAKIKQQASDTWEEELKKIEIVTPNKEYKRVFYTAMYQALLAPTLLSDIDGNYKGADQKVHKAEGYDKYDTFSLWDTYRATHPLYTLIHTNRVPDMINSFLSHYDETGLLPVWSMKGNETNMMIGYHAVPVITDAYFKGIKGFDVKKAYEACKASAMNEQGDAMADYMKFGYVPLNFDHENWSVSKTLEYAYDDWCIAQFAKDLGKMQDYEYFSKRAENWRNVYDKESSFMRPKDDKGEFIKDFIAKDYTDHFCESNAWQYFWYVPQNVDGLIESVGGAERFEQKLDSMFSYYPTADDKLPIFSTGMIGQYAHGNEPSHHVAYLYNYINKPKKGQRVLREIMDTQYKSTPDGVCGNEDCGQMSSWFILSSLGIYPVNPGNAVYDLGTPLFPKATVHLGNGKTLTVIGHQTKTNPTVTKVMFNGKELKDLTITHQELTQGGTLEFLQ